MKRFLLLWLGTSAAYSALLIVPVLWFPQMFNLPVGPLLALYLLGPMLQFPVYFIGAKRLLVAQPGYAHAVAPALIACFATAVVPVVLAIVLLLVGCSLFPHACHVNLMPN